MMVAQNPDYKKRIEKLFADAPFLTLLGVELVNCKPGLCETQLSLKPHHLQQDGIAHAGVLATLADHTAGGAAGSLMADDQIVLTTEFKINLLRPAQGKELKSVARVLQAGKTLACVEVDVLSDKGVLVAKALVSLVFKQKR